MRLFVVWKSFCNFLKSFCNSWMNQDKVSFFASKVPDKAKFIRVREFCMIRILPLTFRSTRKACIFGMRWELPFLHFLSLMRSLISCSKAN